MLRMITQGRELKEDWRTLAELRLREPYGVHVMRRTTPPQRSKGSSSSSSRSSQQQARRRRRPWRAPTPTPTAAPIVRGRRRLRASRWTRRPSTTGPTRRGRVASPGQGSPRRSRTSHALFELLTLQQTRALVAGVAAPDDAADQTGRCAPGSPRCPRRPGASPDWPSLLHMGPSSFKLLYSLQIVDCPWASTSATGRPAAAAEPIACKRRQLLQIAGGGGGHGADGSGGPALPRRRGTLRRGAGVRGPWRPRAAAAILMPADDADDLLAPQRGSQRKPCLVLLLRLLCQFLLARPSLAGPGACPSRRPSRPSSRLTLPTSAASGYHDGSRALALAPAAAASDATPLPPTAHHGAAPPPPQPSPCRGRHLHPRGRRRRRPAGSGAAARRRSSAPDAPDVRRAGLRRSAPRPYWARRTFSPLSSTTSPHGRRGAHGDLRWRLMASSSPSLAARGASRAAAAPAGAGAGAPPPPSTVRQALQLTMDVPAVEGMPRVCSPPFAARRCSCSWGRCGLVARVLLGASTVAPRDAPRALDGRRTACPPRARRRRTLRPST